MPTATLQANGKAALQAARDVVTAADHAAKLFVAFTRDLDASDDLLPPLRNGLESEAQWFASCLRGGDDAIPMINRELLIDEVKVFERALEITLKETVGV